MLLVSLIVSKVIMYFYIQNGVLLSSLVKFPVKTNDSEDLDGA